MRGSGRTRLAVAVCLLALTGCSAISSAASRKQAHPLVVILLDVSRSTADPQIRARYLDAVTQVLDDVAAEHGTIVGDVIDENPLAHASYPIDATFATCDPLTDNALTCDARSRTTRQQVLDTAKSILATTAPVAGTDIVDGLRLAERVFASYPELTVRRLVICSDMVQHPEAPSATSTGAGPRPRLPGVEVYAVGAGVVSHTTLRPRRILAIQRGWQTFLASTGAELSPARYGPTLVRFP
jgi:hypothetical protein